MYSVPKQLSHKPQIFLLILGTRKNDPCQKLTKVHQRPFSLDSVQVLFISIILKNCRVL